MARARATFGGVSADATPAPRTMRIALRTATMRFPCMGAHKENVNWTFSRVWSGVGASFHREVCVSQQFALRIRSTLSAGARFPHPPPHTVKHESSIALESNAARAQTRACNCRSKIWERAGLIRGSLYFCTHSGAMQAKPAELFSQPEGSEFT